MSQYEQHVFDAIWIGGFDPPSIRKLLDIPEHVVPVGIVDFGYPAQRKAPRTQYLEEAIYWQKYDPERAHQPRPGSLVRGRS